MPHLVRSLLAACVLSGAVAHVAMAADFLRYDADAFKAAQAAGKPVLVEIDASWCPTCAKQRPIIDRLGATTEFKNLQIYVVDFDSQKSAVRHFHADMQSTLIVFHGKQETGRSVGETDPGAIQHLLEKAMG